MTGEFTFEPYEHPAPPPLEACWQEREQQPPVMDDTAPYGTLPNTLYRMELHHLDDLRRRAGVYS